MLYYATDDGTVLGPFSIDALRQMRHAGLISDETLVAADGDPEWLPWSRKLQDLPNHLPILASEPDADSSLRDKAATTTASAEVVSAHMSDAPLIAKRGAGKSFLPYGLGLAGLGVLVAVLAYASATRNNVDATATAASASSALELPNSLSCNSDSFPAVRGEGSLIFDAKSFGYESEGFVMTGQKTSWYGPPARRLGGGWVFESESFMEGLTGRQGRVEPSVRLTLEPVELRGKGRFKVNVTVGDSTAPMYCIEAAQSMRKKEH